MSVQWDENSFYKKEMRKWDAPKRQGGMNCDGWEEFPRMLYKAQFNQATGRHEVLMYRDIISPDKTVVLHSAEEFNRQCQLTVNSREEYVRAKADGWRESPSEAMQYHEAELDRVATAAAERAYDDRNMSAQAQREIAAAVQEAGGEHVPEVKAKRPYRRRQPVAPSE